MTYDVGLAGLLITLLSIISLNAVLPEGPESIITPSNNPVTIYAYWIVVLPREVAGLGFKGLALELGAKKTNPRTTTPQLSLLRQLFSVFFMTASL